MARKSVKFGTSTSKVGDELPDLKAGFTWFAAIKIASGPLALKRSIWSGCAPSSEILTELFIDKSGALVFVVGDVRVAIDKEKFAAQLDAWAIMRLFSQARLGKIELSLSLNELTVRRKAKYVGEKTIESNYLGSAGGGNTGATFELGELILYKGRPSTAVRAKTRAYLTKKWLEGTQRSRLLPPNGKS